MFPYIAIPLLCALAPPDSARVIPIPGIEVRDARPADDPALRLSPGFARAYDVSRAAGRFATTSDVLAEGVGVHVRQFGGLGSFGAVSIRGSSSAQVAYFLDGVPLNQAQYGVVNAADLPLEALERIEVYRGTAPLAFDSPGGGAVELVTRTAQGAWSRGDFGGGSFGTHRMDASAGFARGGTSGFAVAQSLSSDGDYPYRDDNGTVANPADDTTRGRANDAFDSSAITARLAQAVGPWRVSALLDHLAKTQGVPGPGSFTTRVASFATRRDVNALRVAAPAARLAPALLVWEARQRDRFVDLARELSGTRQATDDHTTRDGARAEAALPLPIARATLRPLALLAEARRERYVPGLGAPVAVASPASARRVVVLGAEQRATLPGARLGATAQIRQESAFDDFARGPAYPGALPSPALARTTRLVRPTGALEFALARGRRGSLSLRASVARLGRTPTLEELFGNRGSVHGNRDALPERVLTRDAGVVFAWHDADGRWLEGTLSAYRSDATDLLVWLPSGNGSSVASNVSAARLSGLELAARARVAAAWTGDVAWTRQWTKDEGDIAYWRGKQLPGHPRDEVHAALTVAHASWRAFGEAHANASHFLDRYNQQRVPARARLDLGGGPALSRHALDLTLECHNVFDARGEDFAGYPLPGRSWALNARFHFHGKQVQP